MASPGSVQSMAAVPTTEPRRSTRVVVVLIALAILVAGVFFVGGRGWRGAHSLRAQGTPTDTFERPPGATALGATEDGRPWQTPAGPWTVSRGQAHPLGEFPTPTVWFALVQSPSERGAVGVTLTAPQDGAGVVLRYQDPQNYWSFTTLPTSLRSVVRLVQRGLVAREQYIPLAVAEVGSQMEVRFDGNWMDFRLNGRRVAGMYDPTLALSTGVGLIAGGPLALDTRFDDFYAVADD